PRRIGGNSTRVGAKSRRRNRRRPDGRCGRRSGLSARAIDGGSRSEADKEREQSNGRNATFRPKVDDKAHGQFAPLTESTSPIGTTLVNARGGDVMRSDDIAGNMSDAPHDVGARPQPTDIWPKQT